VSDYPSSAGLVCTQQDSILRIIIDRPDTRNSIDAPMLDTLIHTLELAGQDEAIRVIVLSGSGQDFCAGSDIVARNKPTDGRPRVGSIQRRVPTQAHRLIPTILTTQVPIVTVVDGWVAGLGFHIAIASDFCVASTSARFWEPFMSRGFTPDSGGTWLLPRLIGMVRARALLLMDRELSGSEAAEWGLIHEAVESERLWDVAEALIDRLAKGPTIALGLTKWLLHSGSEQDLEQHLRSEAFALELTSRSQDFKEGLAAFRDRRDPDFLGR
jgi:2-(1,2-epoxy-1,2-dihydrophenyl)acetyl-CoA isomerase